MKRKYYEAFLQLFAFLLPVYFIFYPRLSEDPGAPSVKPFRRAMIAGFCFYGIVAVVVFAII